jgi:hypothetical protein
MALVGERRRRWQRRKRVRRDLDEGRREEENKGTNLIFRLS